MATLEYRDSVQVIFRDGSYRWLDAAHFHIEAADSDPRHVLGALLRHDQYIDHYTTLNDVASTPEVKADLDRQRSAFRARVARDQPAIRKALENRPPSPARPPLHGPYYLDRISPDSFDLLDGAGGLGDVMDWLRACDPPVPPTGQLQGDLPALLQTVETSDVVYRLRDLGASAVHDYGNVVQPYIELVAIDSQRVNAWLIAGGTD